MTSYGLVRRASRRLGGSRTLARWLAEIVRPLVIPVDVYVVEHHRARPGPG